MREKSERTSENSHSPPSSDPASHRHREKKKPTRKKRGGQPGHSGHSRPLYPESECQSVTDHYPKTCQSCGERLVGVDPNPYRHQVVEPPPIRPHVEEHRLHQLTCSCCGRKTRAVLPGEVEVSGYGPRVVAIVAVSSGMYRHSHRMIVSTLSDLFGVKIALGTVNRSRQSASESLKVPVDEAALYLLSAPIVGADETGSERGNTDGKNSQNQKAWLWVVADRGTSGLECRQGKLYSSFSLSTDGD